MSGPALASAVTEFLPFSPEPKVYLAPSAVSSCMFPGRNIPSVSVHRLSSSLVPSSDSTHGGRWGWRRERGGNVIDRSVFQGSLFRRDIKKCFPEMFLDGPELLPCSQPHVSGPPPVSLYTCAKNLSISGRANAHPS